MTGASWMLTAADELALRHGLERVLADAEAQCALLVDRGGQLLVLAGERPAFDLTTFATLTAADFSANDQLARLLGASEFSSLCHQGARESMLVADVAGRAILVILFDDRTTLGLVRLRAKPAAAALAQHVQAMIARDAQAGPPTPLLAGADDEIDRLFQ